MEAVAANLEDVMRFCGRRCHLFLQLTILVCLSIVAVVLIEAASGHWLSPKNALICLNLVAIAGGFIVALSVDRWRRDARRKTKDVNH